jgi:hypothetical protein
MSRERQRSIPLEATSLAPKILPMLQHLTGLEFAQTCDNFQVTFQSSFQSLSRAS